MVDTLGLPTVFFTHSAADLQWPELARLICPDDPDNSSSRSKAVMENPMFADWFFYHCIVKFMEVFYKGILKATDYWMRFEYQHRGSPHVHGVAWLEDAPDIKKWFQKSGMEILLMRLILHLCNISSSTLTELLALYQSCCFS